MNNINKKEKIIILGMVLLLLFIGVVIYSRKSNDIEIEKDISLDKEVNCEENLKNENINSEDNDIMMVHISGAVKKPGIVEIKMGDRLVDAIELSGGLTDQADENQINLAKRLSDEDKIYIPSKGEEIEDTEISQEEVDDVININKCTKEELMTLPGVGDVTAQKIIDYREENTFEDIEDIMSVSGIGEKKFESIESLIKVK